MKTKSNKPTETKEAMKTMKKYLSMAALALVGAVMAGCSSDDNIIEQTQPQTENKSNAVILTTTVGLDGGASTRALAADGTKTFAEGELLALVYKNTSGTTVKVVSDALKTEDIAADAHSATFTFTLEAPDKTKDVTYIYPAAMANADGSVNYDALNTQDGTLMTLANNLDLATYTGAWDVDNLPGGTLENQLAILAITLKNEDGSSEITGGITGMTLGDGTNTYTVTRSAAAGPIYVAIQPTSDAGLTITATDGTKNYTKSLTDKTYAASNGYSVSWRMTEAAPAAVDLSMVDNAGNDRASQWTANCYMVHTAGDYKLPLVYGNAIKNGAANTAAYTGIENTNTTLTFPNHAGDAINAPWITKSASGEGVDKGMEITVASAELLWQDAEGLITAVGISGDYLTLTVGKDATTQEGNALVAAKDGSGTIVWSWHIWVTTQTFATLTTVATGSHDYQVTPVNLGWVPTGGDGKQGYNTFYQWGRKDPFKGTGDVTYEASTNATIADNIKNPTTHYYNSSSKGSCTTEYYNMWDAQNTAENNVTTATKKTVYDPSPAGFCVPTGNLYYFMGYDGSGNREMGTGKWDGTNKGATWDISITGDPLWFPASGYRSSGGGALGSVGSSGYCWSASPLSSGSGRRLGFDSSGWYWGSNYRAYGFPVRAVAEE